MPRSGDSRRRGSGEHSIYRRSSDGRWVGSITLGWDPGGRRRRTVYGRTRAEVVAKLKELDARLTRGEKLPDQQLTVDQFLRRWLTEVVPPRVSASTLHNYTVRRWGFSLAGLRRSSEPD